MIWLETDPISEQFVTIAEHLGISEIVSDGNWAIFPMSDAMVYEKPSESIS